jgi:hypothetical protein
MRQNQDTLSKYIKSNRLLLMCQRFAFCFTHWVSLPT